MSSIDTLQKTIEDANTVVRAIGSGDWSKGPPCTEWDVRGLVEHMSGVCAMFGQALGGGAAPSGDVSVENYARVSRALVDAFRAPGAMDKTLKLPMGELPGNMAINIAIGDQVIHTWDVAKALGRDVTLNPEAVEGTYNALQQLLTADRRGPGKPFAEAVPCDEAAPMQQRLIAYSGRQP